PIPNREVKPRSADDTASTCGKVGRRRPYSGSLSIALGLFCFHASPSPRREAKRREVYMKPSESSSQSDAGY
ncbi:MAG: hypothetical protein IKW51_07745, partial [Bacteroidales bacterium]|nr:hypothetical protein [Bacteroidales bacterium]